MLLPATPWRPAVLSLLVCQAFSVGATAQSSVRGWGGCNYDTESRYGTYVQIAARDDVTGLVRADGRVFVQGQNGYGVCEVPPPPPGLRYTRLSISGWCCFGLLSDGTVATWGYSPYLGTPPAVPVPPPGTRYVDLAGNSGHLLLLRDDGVLLALGDNRYGQCTVPSFPPGTTPAKICVGPLYSTVLLSDGSIQAWGDNTYGQVSVPPAPSGSYYVDVAAGHHHMIAVRSDGAVIAWGENRYGQCNVPPPPVLTSYQLVGAGDYHSVAWRSDGQFVVWGHTGFGQGQVPQVAPGLVCTGLMCGHAHTAALFSDGSTRTWGVSVWMQSGIPDLPRDVQGQALARHRVVDAGMYNAFSVLSDGSAVGWGDDHGVGVTTMPLPNAFFRKVCGGARFAVALRADGSLLAWGDNSVGRTTVPPLPPGVTYVDFEVCTTHTVALRSDGEAVHFGYNGFGEGNIPALPNGLRYTQVEVEEAKTVLLRSDGSVVCLGNGTSGNLIPPSLPPNRRYVEVAAPKVFNVGLISDGSLVYWGGVPRNPGPTVSAAAWRAFPPLPAGVTYVEVSGGIHHVVARRSDGEVVVCGYTLNNREHMVPPLDPGTSYVQVSGGFLASAARVGPTSTYVTFANGCAGTLPAPRLIPMDTPRIGAELPIHLFDLPANAAFLAFGWNRTPPVSLASIGMPGCSLHISLDALAFVAGQNTVGTFTLSIPDVPSLVGLRFHHQALVLDPGANTLGAVVSGAAEGIVGNW